MRDPYPAYVAISFTLKDHITREQLLELLDLVTPAYISAARRDVHKLSCGRLCITSPHPENPNIRHVGTLDLHFESNECQWFLFEEGPGSSTRMDNFVSWPMNIDATPPQAVFPLFPSSRSNSSDSLKGMSADFLEITPDICTCIAQFLVGDQMYQTCASLNATSSQVRYATLPILYNILVWKSSSWEATSLSHNWDWTNMRQLADVDGERMRSWRRMINGEGSKYIQ